MAQPSKQQLVDLWRQWPWVYPRGVVLSVRDWVRQAAQNAGPYVGLRANWCEEMYPGGLNVYPPPADLPAAARQNFFDAAARKYPAAAVFHLHGASLVGDAGLVVTADNRVLLEFFHRFDHEPARASARGRAFEHSSTDVQRVSDPIGLLAAPEGWNYYHWLFDVLPRVHLLERWRRVIARYAVFSRLSAVQQETLALLGIPADQLLPLVPKRRIKCHHLYLPSLPGSVGSYPPWSLAFLRQTFLPLAAAIPGRGPRIYIKRGPSAQRPVLNEADLVATLARRGFVEVSLETLGFLQQVAIFRDAREIVAPHGAGLANLVFTSPGAALLELYSPVSLRPDCYFALAQLAGIKYDCWLDEEPPSPGIQWGAMRADLEVVARKADFLGAV